ncbi:MAG: transcription factor S [Candidatus Pacearchaeota archaeon]
MKFCPKCGAVLVKKGNLWACPKGDYKTSEKIKIESKEIHEKTKIGIVKEGQANVYPTVTATCPKCGHDKAYFFTIQTRAGDEAETRFFTCTKCGYRWREYS